MSQVSFLKHDDTVTVVYDGNVRTFDRTSPQYDVIIDYLKTGRMDELPEYLNSFKKSIESKYEGFTVEDDIVYVDGKALPTTIGNKLQEFAKEGLPYKHILRFWTRLQKNPSRTCVNEIFGFLNNNNIPIFEDGCILAWKSVRGDFRDWHSNSILNRVGDTIEVPRNTVDDSRQSCSNGIHFGNFEYASHFNDGKGGHLLEGKIDPADVVSIPEEGNWQKMRVCKYTITRECDWDQPSCKLAVDENEYFDNDDDYEDSDIYDEDDDFGSDLDEDEEDCY